jgi:hypothetical protein
MNKRVVGGPEEWDPMRAALEDRAIAGDPNAQNALAGFYVEASLRLKDAGLLDVAEEWFHRAAENGHEEAKRFLKSAWSSTKAEYRARIDDGA